MSDNEHLLLVCQNGLVHCLFTMCDCLGVAPCCDVALFSCFAPSYTSTLILDHSSCSYLLSVQCNTTPRSIWYGSRVSPHRDGNVCTAVVETKVGIRTKNTKLEKDPTCVMGTWDAKSEKCKYCESGYTYRYVRVRSEGVVTACGLLCVLVFLCSWQGRLGSLWLSHLQLFAHHVIRFCRPCLSRSGKDDCRRAKEVVGTSCDNGYYLGTSNEKERCLETCPSGYNNTGE